MQSGGLDPASLRPRNRRFYSGLDELADDAAASHGGAIGLTSPYLTPFGGSPDGSRAPSPIPSKHPSRASTPGRKMTGNDTNRSSYISNSSPRGKDNMLDPDYGNDLASSLSGLWGRSWTSLQGLASNVLGSDATAPELFKDKAPPRTRRPFEATHSKAGRASRDPSLPGGGSIEDRQATLRAKKRQELLSASPPSLGSHAAQVKRRMSDDFESASAPPGEHDDREMVVYVHHVSKDDTLAGISIKYNCNMPIIKRANRLWSNDGVQARKHLLLPLDECHIRGRPTASPDVGPAAATPTVLHLQDDQKTPKPLQGPWTLERQNSTATIKRAAQHSRHGSALSSASQRSDEALWRHDSWVLLEGFTAPTEIARISRREMGYFPRGRRKSVACSDLDTPSASLDLTRAPVRISEEPGRDSSKNRPSRSSSTGQWAQQMQGPGGVGKLGGKGVSVPGPSQDKLNKVFGKLAPQGSPPNGSSEELDNSHQFAQTVQNVGGVIEGWVRNLAKNAAKVVEPGGISLGASDRRGDLIELSNAFDADEPRGSGESAEEPRGRSAGRPLGGARTASPDEWLGQSKKKGE